MTNPAINSTVHTQQQLNHRSRKRKHLEITGNSKLSKSVPIDAASSNGRQPYPLIPTPPLTEELTLKKAADTVIHSEHQDCDHLWGLIREWKARQYSSNLCPFTMDAKDGASAITGITTATQARKEQQRFAEEVLHPRWIAIQRERDPVADPLSVIEKLVQEALDGDSESIQQPPDITSIVGNELFTSINEGQRVLIKSWLEFLSDTHASEAQWESRLWRPWFLKDNLRMPPNCDPLDSKPFMGQIVQAKMSLSSGGAVIPPLLASADARRQSGWVVAPVTWSPNFKNQKGNHILWYTDYLYAVSQSSLKLRIKRLVVNSLPAFRLAQAGYLPANWLAEIKSDDTDTNNLAAENYSALMSAYLLHERLLLHWIAKNNSINSNNPVEFDDSLAVHCITCCGPACKIWRMAIRTKETSSSLEPIRYDMQLLDAFSVGRNNGEQRLCEWINALNALALTVQFEGIIEDLKDIQTNASSRSTGAGHSYSWTSKVGFVYKAGSATEICVTPLDELRKAYNNGAITAEQPIGDKVVQDWNEKGQALVVDITTPAVPRVSGNIQDSHIPELARPSVSSARSAGNAWMAQFTRAELRQLSVTVVERIARVLSNRVNSGEDIGSTKEGHMKYITRAQQALAAEGMRIDLLGVWKDMGLLRGDLGKLRVDTLRAICNNVSERDPGPNATKGALVATLEPLLTPSI